MAEYKQGTGPDRLEQGEAQALNAAANMVPQTTEELAMEFPGVEWADGSEDAEMDMNALDEDGQILFGPPENIGSPAAFGLSPADREPVPAHIIRRMPILRQAAANPMAPESLKAAVRLLERRIALYA